MDGDFPQFPGRQLRAIIEDRVQWTSHVRRISGSLLRMEKNRFWEFTSRWQSQTTTVPSLSTPRGAARKKERESTQIALCCGVLAYGFSFPTIAKRGPKRLAFEVWDMTQPGTQLSLFLRQPVRRSTWLGIVLCLPRAGKESKEVVGVGVEISGDVAC